MLFNRIVILMAAFAACSTFCRAQEHASNSSRQLDYPLGWEKLMSAWRQIEEEEYNETGSYNAKVEAELHPVGGGKKIGTVLWTIRTKPGYKHIAATHITANSGTGEEIVYARSPDYAFALKRRKKEQEWKLVYFTKARTSINDLRFEESLPGHFGLSVLYPLGTLLENKRGSEYFYDKDIKRRIQDLKLTEGDRPHLEWMRDGGEYRASVVMDPAPNYIIRKFESRSAKPKLPLQTTFIRELLMDAKRPTSALPLCKSIAYKFVVDKEEGETLNDVRITFSAYSFDPPPDDIFRLSYYGLPESPAASITARRKPWLWLSAASVGCFVIAFLFRRLSRRKAETLTTGDNRQ